MSFRVSPKLTRDGQDLLMKSLRGTQLNLATATVQLGSSLQQNVSAWTMTGCLSPVAEFPVTSAVWRTIKMSSVGMTPPEGEPDEFIKVLRVRAMIEVGLRPDDFILSELALLVPNPFFEQPDGDGVIDTLERICFCYTNGADDPEVYRMRGSVLTEEMIDLYFVISDDANIQITIDESGLRATIWDIVEYLTEHNDNPDAHPALRKKIEDGIEEHNTTPGRHTQDFAAAAANAHSDAAGQVAAHNSSNLAHSGLFMTAFQNARDQAREDIAEHNASATAHADLRSALAAIALPRAVGPWTTGTGMAYGAVIGNRFVGGGSLWNSQQSGNNQQDFDFPIPWDALSQFDAVASINGDTPAGSSLQWTCTAKLGANGPYGSFGPYIRIIDTGSVGHGYTFQFSGIINGGVSFS